MQVLMWRTNFDAKPYLSVLQQHSHRATPDPPPHVTDIHPRAPHLHRPLPTEIQVSSTEAVNVWKRSGLLLNDRWIIKVAAAKAHPLLSPQIVPQVSDTKSGDPQIIELDQAARSATVSWHHTRFFLASRRPSRMVFLFCEAHCFSTALHLNPRKRARRYVRVWPLDGSAGQCSPSCCSIINDRTRSSQNYNIVLQHGVVFRDILFIKCFPILSRSIVCLIDAYTITCMTYSRTFKANTSPNTLANDSIYWVDLPSADDEQECRLWVVMKDSYPTLVLEHVSRVQFETLLLEPKLAFD